MSTAAAESPVLDLLGDMTAASVERSPVCQADVRHLQ